MPILLLLSVLGCTTAASSTSSGLRAEPPGTDACAAATELVAPLLVEAAELRASGWETLAAGENFADMRAVALRSASPVLAAPVREALAEEFASRTSLATQLSAANPELSMAALELDGLAILRPRAARIAVARLTPALEELAGTLASISAEHRAVIAEASAALTASPECTDLIPEAPDFTFDPDTASFSAAQANVTEAREAVAAMQDTDDLVLSILAEMRGLAVLAASETVNDAGRSGLQARFVEYVEELERIAATATFNGHAYASGRIVRFEVPVDFAGRFTARPSVPCFDVHAAALGVDTGSIDLSTAAGAMASIALFDAAVANLSAHATQLFAVDAVLVFEAERIAAEL